MEKERMRNMIEFIPRPRNFYIEKIKKEFEKHDIVFLLGARRTGKTCISMEFEEYLLESYKPEEIRRINFEVADRLDDTAKWLIECIDSEYEKEKHYVCILDEISVIPGWEESVNYFMREPGRKILICSSNKKALSSKLDAVQNGEYGTVLVLPLSLPEFIEYHQIGDEYSPEEIHRIYMTYGALPILRASHFSRERARVVHDGSYSSIVIRDVLESSGKSKMNQNINDPVLLRKVIMTLARNIGVNISATGVCNIIGETEGKKPAPRTVENYIKALLDAHFFYVSERYDLKADKMLKTLPKYYIVDRGLHTFLVNEEEQNEEKIIENNMYLEFKRRGYSVFNGKSGNDEIKFVIYKEGVRTYVELSRDLKSTGKDEVLSKLRRIKDNYPKIVVVKEGDTGMTEDGIRVINLRDFLMGTDF